MYLTHFGLNEPPFRITPHTEFFFDGANRGATLEALLYAITHDEGIVKVSGEVGSGKTMLCRVLMERLPEQVDIIYLANPSLSRAEILHAVADELKIRLKGSRATLILRALQEHLIEMYGRGRRVVVLIDEAHAMPTETLEEIRLLSNLESNRHKLLQIVLFGQPELDDILGATHMRQLRERITHSFQLGPLVRSDVAAYIGFRMAAAGYRGADVFSPAALRKIAAASEGLTRRINILADKALLAAFSENTRNVTVKHVKAAIRDSEFSGLATRIRQRSLLLGGGALLLGGVALGVAIALLNVGISTGVSPLAHSSQPAAIAALSVAPVAVAPKPPKPQVAQALESPKKVAREVQKPVTPATLPPAKVASVAVEAEKLKSPKSPVPVVAPGGLADDRIAATRIWLQQAPAGEATLQVAFISLTNTEQLENFLKYMQTLGVLDQIHVFQTKTKRAVAGGYSITFGSYASREAAAKAITTIPAALKTSKPVVRTVNGIRAETAV